MTEPVSISCDECQLEGTAACGDCVVTFLLGEEHADVRPQGAVIIDASEARAVRMLQRAGLVPSLKFQRRVG